MHSKNSRLKISPKHVNDSMGDQILLLLWLQGPNGHTWYQTGVVHVSFPGNLYVKNPQDIVVTVCLGWLYFRVD